MSLNKTSLSSGARSPVVTGFYHEATGSIQYVVADPGCGKAALIDVVRDFNAASARISDENVCCILDFVESNNLEVEWILDTHPHADHLMASAWLKDRLAAPNAIGAKVCEIADLWHAYYHHPVRFDPQRDFDRLFADGDTFKIGTLTAKVIFSPGHTLGSITYVIGHDAAFVHDTLMQPDAGTARADFPGGSASQLYDTLRKLLQLPDGMRLFVGHDYGTDSRDDPEWMATVSQQRNSNIHIGGDVTRAEYVALRQKRDRTLALPDRMLHVLQLNLRAGKLPEPEDDGHRYLKIPLNRFGET